MENSFLEIVIKMIKLPIILLVYIFLMIFSFIIPSRYFNKIFNINQMESDITLMFNNPKYLKVIALILTIMIYVLYTLANGGF